LYFQLALSLFVHLVGEGFVSLATTRAITDAKIDYRHYEGHTQNVEIAVSR
jgi:hypothetical protein